MSQVARVFVVLNLLMAAGFLFSAATFLALNDDYRVQYSTEKESHGQTRTAMTASIETIRGERDALQAQVDSLSEQKANLEGTTQTQLQSMKSAAAEIETKNAEIARLTDELGRLTSTIDRQHTDLVATQRDNESLHGKARDAVDAEAAVRAELATAQDDIRGLQDNISSLETAVNDLTIKTEDQGLMIAAAIKMGYNPENLAVMKPVRGQVVGADSSLWLVMVNVGQESGVEKGYVMDIVRGGDYIGRFKVDEVFPRASSGTLTLVKPGMSVRVGDTVTTTL